LGGGSVRTRGRAGIADQPSIAAGAGSVWVTYTAGNGTIVASGAPVTGLGTVGSFIPRQTVPGTTGKGDYGDVAIGPSGQVMVTYQNPTGGQSGATIY